jgi:hypothetical protein
MVTVSPTKAAAETAETADPHRCRAVRAVASASRDVADCIMLLNILGLNPTDGKEASGG